MSISPIEQIHQKLYEWIKSDQTSENPKLLTPEDDTSLERQDDAKLIFDTLIDLNKTTDKANDAFWYQKAADIQEGGKYHKKYLQASNAFANFLDNAKTPQIPSESFFKNSDDLALNAKDLAFAFDFYTQKEENKDIKGSYLAKVNIDSQQGIDSTEYNTAKNRLLNDLKELNSLPKSMQEKIKKANIEIHANFSGYGIDEGMLAYTYTNSPLKRHNGKSVIIVNDARLYNQDPKMRLLGHEISHAVHDNLPKDQKRLIEQAYQKAKSSYGDTYGATNEYEYFSVTSEAYFSKWRTNNTPAVVYPFDYATLEKDDPTGLALMKYIWWHQGQENIPNSKDAARKQALLDALNA